MKFRQFEFLLKTMYKEKKYIIISLITAIVLFVVFYKLMLATIAGNSLKTFIMMWNYNYTYFTLLSFFIISVLFGIYLSLAVYRFNLIKKSRERLKGKKGRIASFFGLIGAFIGAFGAGCPTCGAVLFGLLGAPLALMYFPFQGAELRILSIVILIVSIYIISKSLIECNVKIN